MKRTSEFLAFFPPHHFRSVSTPCALFPLISVEISHDKYRDSILNATAVLGNWERSFTCVVVPGDLDRIV
jgi:hypothetical protein